MPVFLEVRPTLPVNAIQEFLAHFKANPGKLSFGTPGNGSTPHLAAEMLKAQASVFAVHLPYRGAAPAMHDLLGGQMGFVFDPGIGQQGVGHASGQRPYCSTGWRACADDPSGRQHAGSHPQHAVWRPHQGPQHPCRLTTKALAPQPGGIRKEPSPFREPLTARGSARFTMVYSRALCNIPPRYRHGAQAPDHPVVSGRRPY